MKLLTKEEKKVNVQKMFDNFRDLIFKSIEIDVDNDLRAYELIFTAVNLYVTQAIDLVSHSANTDDKDALLNLVERYLLDIKVPEGVTKEQIQAEYNETIKAYEEGSKQVEKKSNVVSFNNTKKSNYDC
jgi:hypothetical protein